MKAKRSEAIEAERSILGAFEVKPDLFPACSLAAEDFGDDRHRTIFAGMAKLAADGTGLDLVTLKTELAQSGQLARAGGVAYVAGLADGVPGISAERLAAWESIVRRSARVRRVKAAFEQGIETANEGDAASALEDARRVLDEVQASCGASVSLSVGEQVEDAARALTAPRAAEEGVSTGLPSLDRIIGPLKAGQLLIVAARPAVGKSILQTNICEASARHGRGVLLLSAEMTRREIHTRRLCAESGFTEFRLGAGLTPRERIAFESAVTRTKARPLYVEDNPAQTLTELRAKARFLQALPEGLALVAVDYLQLFVASPKFGTRESAVADFSRGLKRLAMDLGVPVICAAQLNRSSEREEREPRLSDLRESGSIEQDADLVLFLHRENEDTVRAILAKARNRATGRTDLRLNGPLYRFEDPANEDEQAA